MNTFILTGTLRVHYVNGRNGRFPIGTVQSPVGTFRVRSKWIEQFEDGEYDGKFAVSEFSLYSYQVYGESRTAIGIQVSEYWLDTIEVGAVADETAVYPDPVEEELPAPTVIMAEPENESEEVTEPEAEAQPESEGILERGEPDDEGYTPYAIGETTIFMTRRSSVFDEPEEDFSKEHEDTAAEIALLQSFDMGWKKGAPYKIDSTLDRADIRQCHAALMALGYRFEPKQQIYCLGGESCAA